MKQLILVLASLCILCSQLAAAAQPNLIFILSDDLAQGDLGCYGQKLIPTPHLDRMAREGTRYTQGYCGTSVCAPSRTSLITGLHTGHSPIRAGDFKLVRYDTAADTRSGRGEPVSAAKLYRLREDIGETKDLATALPDKVKELQAKWNEWNKANVKPLWSGGKADNDGPEPGTPAKKAKKNKDAK